MDLTSYIDTSSTELLNAKGNVSDVLATLETQNTALAGISSDCDPQLLLTVHSKEPVKIASIKFESAQASTAPRKVKLFANKLNVGFSEAEDLPATQELTLTAKDTNASPNALETSTKVMTAKFAKVSSLTIFIVDNQSDDDTTTLAKIVLFGSSQSGAPPSNVKVINSATEYNNYVKNTPGKMVVAYFHAPWCSHCKTTSPLLTKISTLTTDLVILSIDIDKLGSTLPEAKDLQGVPHFKIYKDGQLIHDEAGVPDVLKNMMQKFDYDVRDTMPSPDREPSGL